MNSLQLAGLEMIGTTVNPEYRLGTGMDFGEILPDTTTIASLLLDGDEISGDRTGNRAWSLTVVVFGATRLDLSTKVDTLLRAVNTSTFDVQWTPDAGLAVVFTAYRATAKPAKRLLQLDSLITEVTLDFATKPFGRSTDSQTLTVPAAGGTPQRQVDSLNTAPTHGTRSTSPKYEGTASAAVTLTRSSQAYQGYTFYSYASPAVSRLITSVDLSGYASMSLRFLWAAPVTFGGGLLGAVTVQLTLYSAGGGATVTANVTIPKNDTVWHLVTFNLDDLQPFIGTLDLTAVTQWQVNITTGVTSTAVPSTSTAYIDDLRAYPAGSVSNSTGEGAVLTVPSILGSARTPINLEIDRASSAMTSLLVHRPPGDQDPDAAILLGLSAGTITVPAAGNVYDGTYAVIALITASDTVDRYIAVSFAHMLGATEIGSTFTGLGVTGTQQIVALGMVTLPVRRMPQENSSTSLVVTATSTGTDVIADIVLCDTRGQTIRLSSLPSGTEQVFIDEPDPKVGAGPIYASTSAPIDRTTAYSIDDLADFDGGPIQFDPGDNRLLVASTSGAPGVTVTYDPRWLDERCA